MSTILKCNFFHFVIVWQNPTEYTEDTKKQGQEQQEEAARRVEERVPRPDTAREDGDGREVRQRDRSWLDVAQSFRDLPHKYNKFTDKIFAIRDLVLNTSYLT